MYCDKVVCPKLLLSEIKDVFIFQNNQEIGLGAAIF